MDLEFAGRNALVTGGSRGIGRAAAMRLAREGANVAISYATRPEPAKAVAREIASLGRKVIFEPCDVSKPADVERLVGRARKEIGPIDLLVHCGAISNISNHQSLSYDIWRQTIEVNLTGTYLVVFAVKDEMLARGDGRIVTISSIAALRPRQMQIHYSSAKAGVIAFTRCCAEAFAPKVRINCLCPGLIETEMAHVLPEEKIRAVIADTPMGRIGQPDEMAGVIRFLLSNDSSFMTGETLGASGGRVMIP